MSNFLKNLLPYIAGAGASGVSSQFSALAPFSAAIGAGAGALANKKNPLAGAAQGFAGGGVGTTLAGGVKGLFSGGSGGALDKFGSGAMSGLKSFGNSVPGFGGVGTSNPTGALAKFFAGPSSFSRNSGMPTSFNAGGSFPSPVGGGGFTPPSFGAGGGGTSNTTPYKAPAFLSNTPASNFMSTDSGTGGNTPPGSMNTMDMFKSMAPGLAVAGIGSALAPQVEAPDYSGVKNDLMQRIQQGGNPEARAAAMSQFMSTVNAPEGGSAEAGLANARLINDRQKADALKQIQEQFSANNGSIMGNSAYNDAVTKSNSTYDQNYAAQAAQLQFQYDQQQKQNKMAAANALQGMDDTQLQYFAGLAGLDVMQIQEKTGMDVASANAIKQIAQTAGELMMQKGLGLDRVTSSVAK